ncbi:MAG TPA: TolC family protein [Longimicrobiaceae bacterium]|nr:TolC family protein [Longimicrobiaceae bacterium]
MSRYAGTWTWGRGVAVPVIALALGAASAAAQTPQARPLSLEEALRLSSSTSEQVEIARAGITRARGSLLQARSAALPQLNGSASYSRALASQFEGLGGGGGPDSVATPPFCVGDFTPDPTLPVEQRLRQAEQRRTCPPGGGFGGIDFSNIGFGAENTYNLGLNFNWSVFNGGRNQALTRVARAGREVAEIGLGSAEAQSQLDVTQAYFDTRLSDQLLQIAEATLAQAEETLRLTELGARVGQQAEFDVLRARVARDNQRPAVIQRRAARDLAYDRLRTLLDIPQGQPLDLTTPLDAGTPPVAAPDTAAGRAPVRQAEQQVAAQRAQLAIARSQRLPSVSLTSQYGQVAFARNLFPELDSFRDNWTVGAALQIPVFTGGRVRGEVLSAEASVNEARAQLEQVRELAELDTRSAYSQLEAARATWEASSGTVEQAERAYQIAEIRFREGISTQIELTDARILLEQARTNRASAARDLQVAQVRVRLLPFLPLSGAGAQGQGAGSGAGAPQTGAGAGQQAQGGAQGAQGGAGAQQGTGGIPGQGFP